MCSRFPKKSSIADGKTNALSPTQIIFIKTLSNALSERAFQLQDGRDWITHFYFVKIRDVATLRATSQSSLSSSRADALHRSRCRTFGSRLAHPQKNRKTYVLRFLTGWTGLEPASSGVTGQHSNQLNYHP